MRAYKHTYSPCIGRTAPGCMHACSVKARNYQATLATDLMVPLPLPAAGALPGPAGPPPLPS